MSEQQSPSWSQVVLWPCSNLPFASTVRSHYFSRAPYSLTSSTYLSVILSLICATYVTLYALGGSFGRRHSDQLDAILKAYGVALGLVAILLVTRWLVHRRIARALSRAGVGTEQADAWRNQWSTAERDSESFKKLVASVPASIAAANAWASAPELPPVTRYCHPTRHTSLTISLPGGAQASQEMFLSRLLVGLASIGGRSVVGRAGTNAVCAVFMLPEPSPTQLWITATAVPTGNVLNVTFETTVEWWAPAGQQMVAGHRLKGDVRLLSRSPLWNEVFRSPQVLLAYLAAPLTVVPTLCSYAKELISAIRRPWELYAIANGWMHPGSGDSLDLAIISALRDEGNLESIGLAQATSNVIQGLRQQGLAALQWAASPDQEVADTGPVASRSGIGEPEED